MAKNGGISRDERIQREINRLKKNLAKAPGDKRRLVAGLVQRAAFLRIELEELEADINENGSTEIYQPNEEAMPITRIRAAAQQYDKLVRSYTTVCRQLADLVPDESSQGKKGETGENKFEALIQERVKAASRIRRVK